MSVPKLKAYGELTKPRPTLLACLTVFLGYFLGRWPHMDGVHLGAVLIGTYAIGGGAASLNQVFERDLDARMKRTEHRPLPSGRLSLKEALGFGILLSILGFLILGLWVHAISFWIGSLMFVCYAFLYTPLKRRTRHSAWIGAMAGALPPLIGWAAGRGSIAGEVFFLFLILFFWQFPHVLSISWIYREDYLRGGFKTLAGHDPQGIMTLRLSRIFSLFLVAVTLLPFFYNHLGLLYLGGALGLGLLFLGIVFMPSGSDMDQRARRFAVACPLYLVGVMGFMIGDRVL